MHIRIAVHRLVPVIVVGSIALAGCGSEGRPATAKPGDAFCVAATKARDLGDEIDPNGTDPDETKDQLEAALAASRAAAKKAPKDFVDIANANVEQQEQTVALLEQYDYNFIDVFTSDEGAALFNSEGFKQNQQDRDEYLEEHCDLQPTDDTSNLQLASGDEGIRQLFKLFEVGTGIDITDEQLDCLVAELSGKISDDDLEAIAGGGGSEQAAAAFGQATITCGVELTDS